VPSLRPGLVAGLLLMTASGASAALTRSQQRCVNALDRDLLRVASATGEAIVSCIDDHNRQRNGVTDVALCVAGDRRTHVERARERAAADETRECRGLDDTATPRRPDAFVTGASVASQAAVDAGTHLLRTVYGADLTGAPITEAEDRDAARCQAVAARWLAKCQALELREFNACKRRGLADGSIANAADLEACMGHDPRGAVAHACDPVTGRVRRHLERRCTAKGVALSTAFPNCRSDDGDDVARCLTGGVACGVCRALDRTDFLGRDCDLLDDGVADLSCPGNRFVRDDQGRALVLHGVNVDNLAKSDPLRVGWIGRADILRLSADWGFNVARHQIFWDAVEPAPGVYDEAYLDRVAERLDWYAEAGVWVILDMHQDVYAERFCCDGAPAWAIRDDALPFTPQSIWFLNYFQPAVRRAFDNFWDHDGLHPDLQDHYGAAWAHVAARFRHHSALLGYDLMNEPSEGSADAAVFESTRLREFYERIIGAVRAVDPDRWIFFEPVGFGPTTGGPSGLPALRDPRPGERRLAYFPHLYEASIQLNLGYGGNTTVRDRWASNREAENAQHRGPLLIGEFGGNENQPGYLQYLRDLFVMADRVTSGWTLWSYDPGSWGLTDGAGHELQKVAELVRAYPQRVAGEPIAYTYDSQTRVFSLRFAERADASGPTEIYVPAARFYPGGWVLEVSDPDGTWSSAWDPTREVLSVWTDRRQGEHLIRITPSP
jgi:endoglycosylceramidase